DRNHCFRADLEIFSRPDNARVDCPRSLSLLSAIEWRFEGKLNEGNQMIERRTQANVLHLPLQVDKAVFHSEAVLRNVGMAFNVELPLACFFIDTERARARARGNRNADDASDRERLQEPQRVGQIAEALTEQDSRRPSTEWICANRARAGAANFDTKSQRDNRFVCVILEKVVFGAEFEVAKATY